jgi:predicted transcriptional regulator
MLPVAQLDALGNPVRRGILELLREGPRPVHELAGAFPVSRPAISRHLRLLQQAGLVRGQVEGRQRVYHIQPEGFRDVRAYCERFWDEALPRFKMVAENLEAP